MAHVKLNRSVVARMDKPVGHRALARNVKVDKVAGFVPEQYREAGQANAMWECWQWLGGGGCSGLFSGQEAPSPLR